MDEMKRAPCKDCSNTYPPECMDFDHIPERGPKLFAVSRAVPSYKQADKIRDEIKKCDLVCANCHRIRTRLRRLGPKKDVLPCPISQSDQQVFQ